MKVKLKKPDDDKLRELILLLSRESEADANFGAIKLNKQLFYCDFLAYLNFGQPITGHEYIALERGPAPKYKMSLLDTMIKEGDIAIRKHEAFGSVQNRAFALREPKQEVFSADELKLIHYVLRNCRGRSGEELSALTHLFMGWRLAQEKETIPYSVALVGSRQPTLDEMKWGLELEPLAQECRARHERATA